VGNVKNKVQGEVEKSGIIIRNNRETRDRRGKLRERKGRVLKWESTRGKVLKLGKNESLL